MKIDVKINSITPGAGAIRAFASVNLDETIAIRNIRVMEGRNGLFASMPSSLGQDGRYYGIVYPLTAELRSEINNAVVDTYRQTLGQFQEQNNTTAYPHPEQTYESAPEPDYSYMGSQYGAPTM